MPFWEKVSDKRCLVQVPLSTASAPRHILLSVQPPNEMDRKAAGDFGKRGFQRSAEGKISWYKRRRGARGEKKSNTWEEGGRGWPRAPLLQKGKKKQSSAD